MASSGSEDARVLMYNKKSNSARTDPLGKSWVKKKRLELNKLKS